MTLTAARTPAPAEQIEHLKAAAPVQLYLIPTHDADRGEGWLMQVWCDDPAPTHEHDPADAVGYLRFDEHAEQLRAATADINRLRHATASLSDHVRKLTAQADLLVRRRGSLRQAYEADIEDELLRLAGDARHALAELNRQEEHTA